MSADRSELTHFYYDFDYVVLPFIRAREVPCTKNEALSRAKRLREMINYFREL